MIEVISLAIIVIILFLALFWLRKVLFVFGFFFRAFMLLMLIVVVGSFVFGYYIVKDANDFRNNFQNSTSMILLKQTNSTNTSIIAGSIINPEKKEYKSINNEQLITTEKLYNENKLSSLNIDYYKIFVIDLNSFDSIKLDQITDKNIELNKTEIREIMLSNSAKEKLADILSKKTGESKNNILKGISASSEEIKSYILSYYITTIFNPKDTAEFVAQLKNGSIKVYKETALFKAIKLVPAKLLDTMLVGKQVI